MQETNYVKVPFFPTLREGSLLKLDSSVFTFAILKIYSLFLIMACGIKKERRNAGQETPGGTRTGAAGGPRRGHPLRG